MVDISLFHQFLAFPAFYFLAAFQGGVAGGNKGRPDRLLAFLCSLDFLILTDWLSVRFSFFSFFFSFLSLSILVFEYTRRIETTSVPFWPPLVRVRGCWHDVDVAVAVPFFRETARPASSTVNLTKMHRPFRRSLFLSVPREPPYTHDTYTLISRLCVTWGQLQHHPVPKWQCNRPILLFILFFDFRVFLWKKFFSVPPCRSVVGITSRLNAVAFPSQNNLNETRRRNKTKCHRMMDAEVFHRDDCGVINYRIELVSILRIC